MPKPIGNLVANLKPRDKVSAKTTAKFGPGSLGLPGGSPAPVNEPKAKPVKYKQRKR